MLLYDDTADDRLQCIYTKSSGLRKYFLITGDTVRGQSNNVRDTLAVFILTQFLTLHEQTLPCYQHRPLRIAQRSRTGGGKNHSHIPTTKGDKYLKRCCIVCLKQIKCETEFVFTSSPS
jgi:hypothetical protein